MSTHGNIGKFSADSETWVTYIEQLQQYFIAKSNKGKERQRAVLLSICGTSTYQLIWSMVSPIKPTEKSLEQIVILVRQHCFPKPSVTMQ